jgi:hypothetical protein
VGIANAANANSINVAIIFGGSELNFCVPFFNPPNSNAKPNTNNEFANIEPTNAACTTLSNPAFKANMHTNNSGKLPNADCNTPVAPGPMRLPSWSVAWPTFIASNTNAMALHTKSKTEFNLKCVAMPVMAAITIAATIIIISFLLMIIFKVKLVKKFYKYIMNKLNVLLVCKRYLASKDIFTKYIFKNKDFIYSEQLKKLR